MSDDITVEPIEGLPERPPEGEDILWQGRPHWWALAVESLAIKWVAGYFVLLTIWRFGTLSDQVSLAQAALATVPFFVAGIVTVALLCLISLIQARSTMYTITSARVVMRIGAALTMTLNLPYKQIANAGLDLRRNGTGTIALEIMPGKTQLSYLMVWPHVRPWKFRTQPALRAIKDAEHVAGILAEAADTRVSVPELSRSASAVAAE